MRPPWRRGTAPSPYAALPYPLNVFAFMIAAEEGDVAELHYGVFDDPSESLAAAQRRATELVLSRLPPAPARVLDVGCGLGTTLARLGAMGYQASGITPDAGHVRLALQRLGEGAPVSRLAFEDVDAGGRYDALLFQESSQYLDSDALFAKAREVAEAVVVVDEFAMEAGPPGTLHGLGPFLAAARRHGFDTTEELDLSAQAAPTVDWFNDRYARYRRALVRELGLRGTEVDELVAHGRRNAGLYRRGAYVYRLLAFHA